MFMHFERRVAFVLQSFNSSLEDLKSKVSSSQSTDEGKGKLFDGMFGCGLVWKWTVRVKLLSSMLDMCNLVKRLCLHYKSVLHCSLCI